MLAGCLTESHTPLAGRQKLLANFDLILMGAPMPRLSDGGPDASASGSWGPDFLMGAPMRLCPDFPVGASSNGAPMPKSGGRHFNPDPVLKGLLA